MQLLVISLNKDIRSLRVHQLHLQQHSQDCVLGNSGCNAEEDAEREKAIEFATEISLALSAFAEAMGDDYRDPIIDHRCTTDSLPFFETGNSSYPGCFATCQFIDYCDMFTYKPEDVECCLFHDAEAEWNVEASPYVCWARETNKTMMTHIEV